MFIYVLIDSHRYSSIFRIILHGAEMFGGRLEEASSLEKKRGARSGKGSLLAASLQLDAQTARMCSTQHSNS
jgi:hypothetical protein